MKLFRLVVYLVSVGWIAFSADAQPCRAAKFSAAIAAASAGDVILIPKGEQFIAEPIKVYCKTNVTIRGEDGATLVVNYSREGNKSVNNGAFLVEHSKGIVFEGLTVTTIMPTTSAGHVIATNPKTATVDVRIDPEFPITGKELLASTDTFDDKGTPDWIIETYNYKMGDKYEVLAPQLIRVSVPITTDFSKIETGHRISFRHSVYCDPVFRFRDCHGVTVRDVLIERCASMCAITVRPCSDFTFERFNVGVGGRSMSALVSANADGIHPSGMSGCFIMRDCHFERMGDDSLNVHANAGYLKKYNERDGTMFCLYFKNGKESPLADDWAKQGDRLAVYDIKTFREKGVVTVAAYRQGHGKIIPDSVPVKEGDILANLSDFPDVRVTGCSVRNTRARGFLLQSRNIMIEDCTFEGTSMPGIVISPDARRWAEVGPTTNALIRNCTFRRCGMVRHPSNIGVIAVKANHDGTVGEHPAGVHRNVRIVGNRFEDCGSRGILVAATDGVELRNNLFLRSSASEGDVKTVNCTNVVSVPAD